MLVNYIIVFTSLSFLLFRDTFSVLCEKHYQSYFFIFFPEHIFMLEPLLHSVHVRLSYCCLRYFCVGNTCQEFMYHRLTSFSLEHIKNTVKNTPASCSGISLSRVAFCGTHLKVGNTPCGIEVHQCLMFFLPNVFTCGKCYCLVLRYLSVLCLFFSSAEYIYLWETLLPGV